MHLVRVVSSRGEGGNSPVLLCFGPVEDILVFPGV